MPHPCHRFVASTLNARQHSDRPSTQVLLLRRQSQSSRQYAASAADHWSFDLPCQRSLELRQQRHRGWFVPGYSSIFSLILPYNSPSGPLIDAHRTLVASHGPSLRTEDSLVTLITLLYGSTRRERYIHNRPASTHTYCTAFCATSS